MFYCNWCLIACCILHITDFVRLIFAEQCSVTVTDVLTSFQVMASVQDEHKSVGCTLESNTANNKNLCNNSSWT